jgi:hypothetical protein
MLSTGAVIGAGANVFDFTQAPKYVRPFAWGAGNSVMDRDGFLKIAARVMPRRQVEMTEAVRAMLESLYDSAVAK